MTVIIACFIAGISTASFFALWVVTSYRELASKNQEVTAAAEQVQMHRALYRQTRGSPNCQAAKKMLETSRIVYGGTVKGYNNCLKNPVYRLPGFVMGFRPLPKKSRKPKNYLYRSLLISDLNKCVHTNKFACVKRSEENEKTVSYVNGPGNVH